MEHSVETAGVVIITRDRPHDLERCLAAVLANKFVEFELIVVDQSRTQVTAQLVEQWRQRDRRVRYIRDAGNGAARARNIGTRATSSKIVVFTDDDCEPDATWLGSLIGALRADPSAGMAYGSVFPAPHDPRDGFIVGFTPRRSNRLTGKLAKLRDAGISANVALRRVALEATGGFDEMLGPGSYFPCAEDYDLTYRVLSLGFAVLHWPEARVVHHGLRDWESGRGLIYRTYIAIGAAYMKHVRALDPVGLALLLQEMFRACGNILTNLATGKKPFGFGRLRGLVTGMLRSYELEIDRRRVIYCPPR